MKPTRVLLCLALLALVPLAVACAATPPAPTAALPSPTPATAPAVATTTPLPPGPTPAAPQTGPYIDPDGLWGLWCPAELGEPQRMNESVTLLPGHSEGAFIVVDSYVGTGEESGQSGEELRNRARDVLSELFGREWCETDIIDPDHPWRTGTSFAAGGALGEAVYMQPGLDRDDTRVYGLILAYPSAEEPTMRPALEAARRSFMTATALPLQAPAGQEPLWAVFSHGLRSFDPPAAHFVALFGRADTGWQERARLLLELPDYVDQGSVRQVPVEPTRLWLTVEGGIGAHGGSFQLLSYAEGALKVEVESTNSAPGAGAMRDLDGDGALDAILNQTDYYVFCYACSVWYPHYQVLRWDGAKFVEVQLATLPDTAPAELRGPLNRAVALAQGGLWKDAQAAVALVPETRDSTAVWDLALIGLHADAFAGLAHDPETPYPLLQLLFYGDYAAVVDLMRPYTPQEIFDPAGPLIAGTVAEGCEAELSSWVQSVTTQALAARQELAAAYYLRGWAAWLADPASPQARADVARAAELAPEESLFAGALAYLQE